MVVSRTFAHFFLLWICLMQNCGFKRELKRGVCVYCLAHCFGRLSLRGEGEDSKHREPGEALESRELGIGLGI